MTMSCVIAAKCHCLFLIWYILLCSYYFSLFQLLATVDVEELDSLNDDTEESVSKSENVSLI